MGLGMTFLTLTAEPTAASGDGNGEYANPYATGGNAY
jgi:hypothetical protein